MERDIDLTRTVGPDGRYGLLRPIGANRTGTFWDAVDRETGDAVTVKLMRFTPPRDRAEGSVLLAEMEALLELPPHPHVLGVLGLHAPDGPTGAADAVLDRLRGVDIDQWLVVLDRVDGRLAKDRFWLLSDRSVERALAVAAGAGEGLAALHDVGRTHGTLGADTVLVDRERGAVLVDVGLRPGGSVVEGGGPAHDVAALVRMVHDLLPGAVLPDDLERCADLGAVLTCLRALTDHPIRITRIAEEATVAEGSVVVGSEPVPSPRVPEDVTTTVAPVAPEPDRVPAPMPEPDRVPAPITARERVAVPTPPAREPSRGSARAKGPPARIRRPERRRPPARAFVAAIAATVAAFAITAVVVTAGLDRPPDAATVAGPAPRSPAPPTRAPFVDGEEPPSSVVMPDIAGLTAAEAREVLVTANLQLARLVPMPGPPGEVVGSSPLAGSFVVPGEAVEVLVGAEPERLVGTASQRSGMPPEAMALG